MRLNHPRIPPVGDNELTAEQIGTLAPAREHGMDADNVVRTLINNPGLAQASLAWGGDVFNKTKSEAAVQGTHS